MLAFILRRVMQSVAVMAVVALIAFSLFNFVGDPVVSMVGQDATMEEKARLRSELGLDQPVVVQFFRFLGNAVQGDFGRSLRQGRSVATLIKERLPATLELSFGAALLALVVGIPAGVYAALRRDSWGAQFVLTASLVGVSLPSFLIGILLILVFAVQLGWLPSFGRGETVALGWWTTGLLTKSGLKALILPVITLSLFQMTLIMRLVRSEMLEVLRTDYIKFARARGLSDRVIHFGHALKNTLVPVITITGLQLAVSSRSRRDRNRVSMARVGPPVHQSVFFSDIPVMAAYPAYIALVFVLNLIVDLMYTRRSACASKGLSLSMKPDEHPPLAPSSRPTPDLHAHGVGLRGTSHRARRAGAPHALGDRHHTGIGQTGIVRSPGRRNERPQRTCVPYGRAADGEENEFARRATTACTAAATTGIRRAVGRCRYLHET